MPTLSKSLIIKDKSAFCSAVLDHIVYSLKSFSMRNIFLMFWAVSIFFVSCKKILNSKEGIVGVKIYEPQENYQDLFEEWKDLGINKAFVSVDLAYDDSFRKQALNNEVQVFIILSIFFNPDALQEHPDWYAITHDGKIAKEEWVEFISPSIQEYRKERISFIQTVVRDTKPDGISLDFIRYFAYWEKIHEGRSLASIPNTSFDSIGLNLFEKDEGVTIPDELGTIPQKASWILENHMQSWTAWKCNNITKMVKDAVAAAKTVQADLLVNLHAVPWREDDFEGAIKK